MNRPQGRRQCCAAWHLAIAFAVIGAVLLGGCDEKKNRVVSPAAVKVNNEEITIQQINHLLQQQRGLKPEQAEAASKQLLERLIDQELALQKATELKLDRDPRVLLQLDAARREIVARAYLEKAGEAASQPTAEEVQKYYEEHPALFKDRRVYNLQEIAIEAKPEQLAEMKSHLEATKDIGEFVEFLKANDYRYSGNQAVRTAEQLPLSSLARIAAMKDGQALFSATPTGALVVVLVASRAQPATLEQARPAIEHFLLNERKRELVAKDIKALRDAATIEYLGPYAQPAPPSAQASSAQGAAPALPAPAASAEPDAPSDPASPGSK
jgi:EpsD family peptidyl-prolyl cis-trans isomerase